MAKQDRSSTLGAVQKDSEQYPCQVTTTRVLHGTAITKPVRRHGKEQHRARNQRQTRPLIQEQQDHSRSSLRLREPEIHGKVQNLFNYQVNEIKIPALTHRAATHLTQGVGPRT